MSRVEVVPRGERIVVVGGPRCGKSYFARVMRQLGVPTFCGDPMSKVKDVESGVRYLPEDLAFSGEGGAAVWITQNWFTRPGPWVCEGHVMARALRRWVEKNTELDVEEPTGERLECFPCDRVIVFAEQRPEIELDRGQASMHKAVMTVWRQIEDYFDGMTEVRTWT